MICIGLEFGSFPFILQNQVVVPLQQKVNLLPGVYVWPFHDWANWLNNLLLVPFKATSWLFRCQANPQAGCTRLRERHGSTHLVISFTCILAQERNNSSKWACLGSRQYAPSPSTPPGKQRNSLQEKSPEWLAVVGQAIFLVVSKGWFPLLPAKWVNGSTGHFLQQGPVSPSQSLPGVATLFSVVYFSRGALPPKKGEKGHLPGGPSPSCCASPAPLFCAMQGALCQGGCCALLAANLEHS